MLTKLNLSILVLLDIGEYKILIQQGKYSTYNKSRSIWTHMNFLHMIYLQQGESLIIYI